MRSQEITTIAFLAIVAGTTACATRPPTEASAPFFASTAVVQEMRETRPAFAALGSGEQAAVHLWLLARCAVGADERLAQFVKLDARTEPALIEAFRMGPPTALLAELADTRRSEHAAIRARLEGEDKDLFDPELRARIEARSEDSYVEDGIAGLIENYRLSAFDGLVAIGTPISVAWLKNTAPALNDPKLRDGALHALDLLVRRLSR